MQRAIDFQHNLARRGQHRVPIPDLIVAAAAKTARLTVLHYDTDFELIGGACQVQHEWVAPRGTL